MARLLLSCFLEIPNHNANSVDPDQTLHFAASDLDLHCLQMSILYDARLKCVNTLQKWACFKRLQKW